MSLWRRDAAALALHIGAAEWRLTLGGRALAQGAFASPAELRAGLEALRIEPLPPGRHALHVTVEEAWVRTDTVTPPAGVKSLAELRALAAARLARVFGVEPREWVLHGRWHATQPFVVTALPRTLVDAASGLCRRLRWTLGDIVPLWIRALAKQRPARGARWAAVVQPGAMTLVHLRDGAPVAARSVRIDASQDEAGLRELAARELWRNLEDAAPTRDLAWTDARSETVGSRGAEALRSWPWRAHDGGRMASRWAAPAWRDAWPSAVAAAALAALAAVGWPRVSALNDEARALAAQLASDSHKAVVPRAAATARLKPPTYSPRQVEAMNRVAHALNTPWPDLFAALERNASAEVALLGVEPVAQQARLRGSAQAKDHRSMIEYVQRLSSQAPVAQARLVRHELDEKNAARPLKFQFEAAIVETDAPAGATR